MHWWDEDAEPEKRCRRLVGDPDGRILGALTGSALRVESEPRDAEIGVIVDTSPGDSVDAMVEPSYLSVVRRPRELNVMNVGVES